MATLLTQNFKLTRKHFMSIVFLPKRGSSPSRDLWERDPWAIQWELYLIINIVNTHIYQHK